MAAKECETCGLRLDASPDELHAALDDMSKGYTRANERAEGLQAELAVAWADCADGSCRACSECCDSLREQLTEAREALEDVLKGAATAEARAEGLAKELEALRAQSGRIFRDAAAWAGATPCPPWNSEDERSHYDTMADLCAAEIAERARAMGLPIEGFMWAAAHRKAAASDWEDTIAERDAATARVAELEATLAHIGPSGGVEQCRKVEARANAAEARVAELEKQLADKEEERRDAAADAIGIEAELAKLREQVDTMGDRDLLLRALLDGCARIEHFETAGLGWLHTGEGRHAHTFPLSFIGHPFTHELRAALNDALTKAVQ